MNILIGYDGSNEAKDALKLAQKHAKAFGAKIEVARSITRNLPLDYDVIQVTEEDFKTIKKDGFVKGCQKSLIVSALEYWRVEKKA